MVVKKKAGKKVVKKVKPVVHSPKAVEQEYSTVPKPKYLFENVAPSKNYRLGNLVEEVNKPTAGEEKVQRALDKIDNCSCEECQFERGNLLEFPEPTIDYGVKIDLEQEMKNQEKEKQDKVITGVIGQYEFFFGISGLIGFIVMVFEIVGLGLPPSPFNLMFVLTSTFFVWLICFAIFASLDSTKEILRKIIFG